MNIKKLNIIYLSIIGILTVLLITISISFMIFVHKNKQLTPVKYNDYYYNKCDTYVIENQTFEKGQIVFLGDSITDLFPLNDYFSDLTLKTYNRGIGGDITQGVIDRLRISVYDLKPSKIVLLIGINDIDAGRPVNYIVSNYNKILSLIKENLPNTEVYCMSLLSQNDDIEQYTTLRIKNTIPKIMKLNDNIKKLAKDFGYTYVDLFSETIKKENNTLIKTYSDDGLHLNANGFEVWTRVIKPYLE